MKNVLVVLLFAVVVTVASQTRAQSSIGRGLMINEVYIGSAGSDDQYIEIYNPQTTTQYLDGCMIVQFDTIGGAQSGQVLNGVVHAWKFPGSPGGKTLPVASKAFVVVAANVSKHSGGLDLSAATYEARASNALPNTKAKQLFNMTPAMTYPGLTPAASGDAIVLTNGSDATIADGVNVSSILDAMQYGPTITQGKFPQSIDSMLTGGPNLKAGYSMERNTAGVTTHSSYHDFSLQYPTPGTQHGAPPPPPPPVVVTPKVLLPFDLNRYVALNHYDTVTAGSAPNQYRSSQTIAGVGLTFQGSSNVALLVDSSYITSSSAHLASLHLRTTTSGDIQVFADAEMINYILPSNLASSFTPPNQWIDFIKMSSGLGTTYAMSSITGTYSGANITITFSGAYKGIEKITVPRGSFDSAYRFDMTGDVNITFSGFTVGSFKTTTTSHYVAGIGMVRQSNPRSGTTVAGNDIPVDGEEKEMTAYGIRARSAVSTIPSSVSKAAIYPNPATATLHVMAAKPIKLVTIFDSRGAEVLLKAFAGSSPEISISDLAIGSYLLRLEYFDGTTETSPFVIQR